MNAQKWYALHVQTGTEEKVKDILNKQLSADFKYVIYKRRLRERKQGQWHMIDRKMFPGYILMNGTMTDEIWQEMRKLDVSFRLLKSEDEYLTLSDQEIRMLGILSNDDSGLVDTSEGFVDGDKVVVTDGPLIGQESLIVGINKRKGRVKVKVNFCGSERVVELSIKLVEKVSIVNQKV